MLPGRPFHIARLCCVLLLGAGLPALSGCAGMAAAVFGAGATAGMQHTLNGITYRTFTASDARVKAAALQALNRMGIKVMPAAEGDPPDVIHAEAHERSIELGFEDLASNTTRMRAVAKQGFFYDSATAYEIVVQTERALARS